MNIFEDIMIANYASISPFLPFFSAKIKKTKNQALPCYFVIGSAATC
jgi:hypothetical protein